MFVEKKVQAQVEYSEVEPKSISIDVTLSVDLETNEARVIAIDYKGKPQILHRGTPKFAICPDCGDPVYAGYVHSHREA